LMRLADLFQKLLLTDLPGRGRAFDPGVEPAAADFQHAADHAHRPDLSMSLDEGELHGCSLAKNAAAFFKISRSISRRAFSSYNRASWDLSEPSRLSSCAASYEVFSIQPRTLAGSTPRLLAASVLEYPCSLTSLTADTLNSRVNRRLPMVAP